jgi:hypothetical protein
MCKTPKEDPESNLDIPNFGSASTWRTSSFYAFCKKEKEKEVNPNKMFKTLMPFDGQQIWMGGEKLRGDKS